MAASSRLIEAPLAPAELVARWKDLCAAPTFEDVAAKVELTEWEEIHNALPKLREKAMACVRAGAREAWLVYPTLVKSRSTVSRVAWRRRLST